jgi:glycerate kinase
LLEGCPIVSASSTRTPASVPPWRTAHGVGISQRVLVACEPFGPRMSAAAVAGAVARGLREGGLPVPDLCLLPDSGAADGDVSALLEQLRFDERMRCARAVVLGAWRLQERTLPGSAAFEIATRARQRGVPSYAVAGDSTLDAFDARMLDLQVVLQARSRAGLLGAGRRLAALV